MPKRAGWLRRCASVSESPSTGMRRLARPSIALAAAASCACVTRGESLAAASTGAPAAAPPCPGELLYNGICLPAVWPPRDTVLSRTPAPPPYLAAPPDVINITLGRQLFVDTFLLDRDATEAVHRASAAAATTSHDEGSDRAAAAADTAGATVQIEYFAPVYDAHNPVVAATERWECAGNITASFASAFSGGIWYDPADALFKLWYRCGCLDLHSHCLATSRDGIAWDKPALDVVPGTNIVLEGPFDGSSVWLDARVGVPPAERFKMSTVNPPYRNYTLLASPDGVHWTPRVNASGPISDRSTIFHNPFRAGGSGGSGGSSAGGSSSSGAGGGGGGGASGASGGGGGQWVFSIKKNFFDSSQPATQLGRSRVYREGADLWVASQWGGADGDGDAPVNWTNADDLDPPVGCGAGEGGNGFTQLYNLDAVAYESVLVGMFSIFTGKDCGTVSPFNRTGEWDSVFAAFSRDGFHWSRPVAVVDAATGRRGHPAFLPMDDTPAPPWVWNKANVQSVAGGFVVLDDNSINNGAGNSSNDSPAGAPRVDGDEDSGDGRSGSNPDGDGDDDGSATATTAAALSTLRFYVGARTGADQLEGNASTGTATLRRDGFAALVVTTAAAAVAIGETGGTGATDAGATDTQSRGGIDSAASAAAAFAAATGNHTAGCDGGVQTALAPAPGAAPAPGPAPAPAGAVASVVTRPVVFSVGARLFVNAQAFGNGSDVVVRVLNATTLAPLAPFTFGNCLGVGADSTRAEVVWRAPPTAASAPTLSTAAVATPAAAAAAAAGGSVKGRAGGRAGRGGGREGGAAHPQVGVIAEHARGNSSGSNSSSLAPLQGVPVRFEFRLTAPAQLFSFWVAATACGESGGYVAAGGPGFNADGSGVDMRGGCALHR